MSSESQPANQVKFKWYKLVLGLFLVVFFVVSVHICARDGVNRVWDWFDPDRQPAVREANALRDAARKRPLTDEEFERALAVLDSENTIAQLSAIATVELDGGHDAARRIRAIEALERCCQKARPDVGAAAGTAAGRLKAEPKGP
jgi:hypothetical protein